MRKCSSKESRTGQRCRINAEPGKHLCALHLGLKQEGSNGVTALKLAANRLGHVAITTEQYQELIRDRESLMKLRLKRHGRTAASWTPRDRCVKPPRMLRG